MNENYDDKTLEELEALVAEYRNSEEATQEELEANEENTEQTEESELETESSNVEEPQAENEDINKQVDEVEQETTEEMKEVEPTSYAIKANGKEYNLSLDELKQMASKGIDYTSKTQKVKPYIRSISAMEQNKISHDDLNLFIDIKKGNKEAFMALAKEVGIDPLEIELDIDNVKAYTPNDYGDSEQKQELDLVIQRLQNDTEFAQTQGIITNLDEQSKSYLFSNPSAIEALHYDVKAGVFASVIPLAEKKAVLDNYSKPILEYYLMAGKEYYDNINNAKANELQTQKQKQAEINSAKANAALPKSRVDRSVGNNIIDIDDDEAYYAWLKKIEQ